MQNQHTKVVERYSFFVLLFLSFAFVLLLFRPFLGVLIVGASLAVVMFPIYEWFLKRKLPNWLSALLVVLLFLILLCGPLFMIGKVIFKETQSLYYQIASDSSSASKLITNIENKIAEYVPSGIELDLGEKVVQGISALAGNVASLFASTFSSIFFIVLTILSLFYFLKDGTHWKKALVILSPLADQDDQKILTRLSQAVNGVIKGYLLIALAQGTLMGIGLVIFGVPNPALWSVAAAIASLVPTLGVSLVSIPIFIFLLTTGEMVNAIGFGVWCLLLVGTIDNILNPIIVGSKINIPPLLILFSVLGGISMMGPVGILIGPLAVSLLYTLISIYRHEFQEKNS